VVDGAGPWGTGPYELIQGFSLPNQRSPLVVLEANQAYWDTARRPRLKRIVFDNTLGQKEAVEMVKSREGQVDLVTGLSPLQTLRVAQSDFATVVKSRGSLGTLFGRINMRKTASPWQDVRLRQALNFSIDRADLTRYAAKGNGAIIPALVPVSGFGFNPDLPPYAFDPEQARRLLREAGYGDGLPLTLIAPEHLEVQASVVSKMIEQGGFTVQRRILDAVAYNRKTDLSHLDQPAEQQSWDIALSSISDLANFPVFLIYNWFVLDGNDDWVMEQAELRHLYDRVLGSVNPAQQQKWIRQMERHTAEQAYLLFLYNPIALYAVNKAVTFVPYVNGVLNLAETSVTEQHWSVRKQKATPNGLN
jgi:peptide/nickel transport system substrate-binding protein